MEDNIKETRHKLFNYFGDEHNLILTESEIDDIMIIFDSIRNKTGKDINVATKNKIESFKEDVNSQEFKDAVKEVYNGR